MKGLLLVLTLLTLSPAARADILYKCDSRGGDRLGAQVRFNEKGGNGYLEVDDWSGYPPAGLVYSSLHETTSEPGTRLFLSEEDRHSGESAELRLPAGFLGRKDFVATLTLIQKDGKRENARLLDCAGF